MAAPNPDDGHPDSASVDNEFTISLRPPLTLPRYGLSQAMTASAPLPATAPTSRTAKITRFAAALRRCSKAATISEYGLGAMLLVAAASAAHSPRLHAVKDSSCEAPGAGCFHQRSANGTEMANKAKAPAPAATKPDRVLKPAKAVQPNS